MNKEIKAEHGVADVVAVPMLYKVLAGIVPNVNAVSKAGSVYKTVIAMPLREGFANGYIMPAMRTTEI